MPRGEVFITSKLWSSNFSYAAARASVRQSLRELGCSYIDLMLLHAPFDPATRAATWRALEDAAAEVCGAVRAGGCWGRQGVDVGGRPALRCAALRGLD